jgi:protein tyrosine phosphatase
MISEEIADELRRRINSAYVDVPPSLKNFFIATQGGSRRSCRRR